MSNVDVTRIADANRKRADSVANAYGVSACHLEEGLSSLPPSDAILLAIPYGARGSYYEALGNRGGALYIEKPLARTVALHRQLCGMYSDYNLARGLNRRAWGVIHVCRDAIKDELFGKIQRAGFTLSQLGGITAGSSYLANAKLAGGGALFEHDVHCNAVVTLTDPHGAQIPFDIEVSILKNGKKGIRLEFGRATLPFSLYGPAVVHVKSKNGKTSYVLSDERELFPSAWRTRFSGPFGRHSSTAFKNGLLTTPLQRSLF